MMIYIYNSEAELTVPFLLCSIDVISKAFEGKSAVNRQRMVYKAIWEELQSTVHAVDQMTTKTPDEAAANK
jgi:stress-induced morphogen